MTTKINIDHLQPHPDNPRVEPRTEVVEALAEQMRQHGFDEAHAIIVRPYGDHYQIVSGHNRTEAARTAGLSEIPSWVRDLDDEAAFMQLVLSNTHSELMPLERGRHALRSNLDIKAYAAHVGRPRQSVSNEVAAARVAEAVPNVGHGLDWTILLHFHAAPRWLWSALVSRATNDEWTVATTRKAVGNLKDAPEPPEWTDISMVAENVVQGRIRSADVAKLQQDADNAFQKIRAADYDVDTYVAQLEKALNEGKPSSRAALAEIANGVLAAQSDAKAQAEHARRQEELARMKAEEQAQARAAKLRESCSLEEWKQLDEETQADLLKTEGTTSFNTTNEAVEWAWFTWNPITGCNHGCPYCYARVIAKNSRMAQAFPNGFKPTLCPSRLHAPRNTKVPKEAAEDARYRNVFVGSMTDLFGRWVPTEWIEAVLEEARNAPNWNFLCLTKFPKRMAEFDIPENVWMGATVDLQARVKATETGFQKVKSKVRWLSVEPMLEPLQFNDLSIFDWIVIGGSSKQPSTDESPATPEWKPPFRWVMDLVRQADEAGVRVYQKTNLLGNRTLEVPFDAPVPQDYDQEAPEVFKYLGNAK